MINQLSLSQLEHKARIENNDLALIILEKMEEELEEAVENALTTNDADYSYEVFDAVQAWVNAEAEKELLHILQYNIVDSTSEKDSRGMHTSGVMVYREAVTGKEISFFITKIA